MGVNGEWTAHTLLGSVQWQLELNFMAWSVRLVHFMVSSSLKLNESTKS